MEKSIIKVKKYSLISENLLEFGFSKQQIAKFFENKDIRLNGEKVKLDSEVFENDEIIVFYNIEMIKKNKPQIIFEDESIIIANKMAGIEIEGREGLAQNLGALAVHRLDRNTRGLVCFAKNKIAQDCLLNAFKNHTITKKYYAEVVGKTDFHNYTFNAFLLKNSRESRVKIFEKKVSESVKISTTFTTIKSNSTSSIVECLLHTGKTHQIRASLAYLKHPIIGDGKYGKNEDNKKFKAKVQRLQSYYLRFDGLKAPLEYLNGREFIIKNEFKN